MAIISKHKNNEIILYDRHDSPHISCRAKDPDGKWHRKTTYTQNLDDALKVAEEFHMELRLFHGQGHSTKRRKFGFVADLYLKELRDEVEMENKTQRNYEDYSYIVQTYLRPQLGRKQIDMIKSRDITEYNKWRAAYHITGPGSKQTDITYIRDGKTIKRPKPKGGIPSHTTRNTENVVLRAIFQTALKHEFLKEAQLPIITLPKKKQKNNNRRPAFTREQYEKFVEFLHYWKDEKHCKNPERRWLLKQYVIFLANTGLRPGKETNALCWKHLRESKAEDGELRYIISVPKNSKTGYRYPVASGHAHTAITQIKMDLIGGETEITPDTPLFCLPDGTHILHDTFRALFDKAIKKCGGMEDEYGEKLSPYSLRHFFATSMLVINKLDIYILAKQMGNSPEVIREHYDKSLPEQYIDDITAKSVDQVISDDFSKKLTKILDKHKADMKNKTDNK